MTRYLLGALLLIVAGYGLVEAWPLIAGPSLSIATPEDGATVENGVLTVRGCAERVALLTLDGAPLLHDETGNFSTTLSFPRGGSLLTFVAADQFGRRITTTRSIFVPTETVFPDRDIGITN